MKKWVLITGASQGIGHEFAKIFAAEGFHLVLVARDEARLLQIAGELSAQYGIKAKMIVKDLSSAAAAQEIFDELQRGQIEISILVNNAGFGHRGVFAEIDLQRQLDLIQVNVTSLVQLTHLFLKPMLARREGRILNVASTAAFVPGPYMQTYYASKAFVHSFSYALASELEGSGVTVTSLCPGLTRSQFQTRANMKRSETFVMMEADAVARIGFHALMAGKPVVVAGWMNKLAITLTKSAPTRWITAMVKRMNR